MSQSLQNQLQLISIFLLFFFARKQNRLRYILEQAAIMPVYIKLLDKWKQYIIYILPIITLRVRSLTPLPSEIIGHHCC